MKTRIVFFFLFSMNCFAWNSESVKLLKNFEYPFGNSFVGTVYSTCRADTYEIKGLPGSFEKISIDNEYYRVNPMKSHLFKTKKKKKGTVVFVTSIFSNYTGGVSGQVLNELLIDGYDVLSLGNPLGSISMDNHPTYAPGDIKKEAEAFYRTTQLTLNKLNIKKAHLLGVSYGAMIASIMASIDREGLFSDLTLLSPPLKMSHAMKNMDSLIDESNYYTSLSPWRMKLIGAQLCYLTFKSSVRKSIIQKAKGIVSVMGFQWNLISTLKQHKKQNPNFNLPTGKNWEPKTRFSNYIKSSELRNLYSGTEDDLFYYLNQLEISYRVMTTMDDPLNIGLQWPKGEYLLSIPKGGHYGLRSFDMFPKFLRSLY